MNRKYFKSGEKFRLDSQFFEVVKRAGNIVEVLDLDSNEIHSYLEQELIKCLDQGLLKFEVRGKNTKVEEGGMLRTNYDFNDLTESKELKIAEFRLKVINPIIEISRARNQAIEKRVKEINSYVENNQIKDVLDSDYQQKVSKSRIYRWIKDYENSNCDLRSLVPSFHLRGGMNKIDHRVIDMMSEIIELHYLTKQRITKKDLWYLLMNRINEMNKTMKEKMDIPCYTTVRNYLDSIPSYELVKSRYSKRDSEMQYGYLGSGVEAYYPLERVEMDTQTLDLIVVDENADPIGRPFLTMAIDKFSRMIVGFYLSFENPSWDVTMMCLMHILSNKSYIKKKYPDFKNEWNPYGIPQRLVIDNGPEFKNKALDDACLQLNIILERCPPRKPEWKGSIERLFGTINKSLIHKIPGTTRSNPQDLAEGEKPLTNACMTFPMLLTVIHDWVVNDYSQSLNKGAKGIPAKIWREAIKIHPVALPNSTDELGILLGKIEKRNITRNGVTINYIDYNNDELHELLKKFSKANKGKEKKFKVKYNPLDLNYVYVLDDLITNEFIKVPSTMKDYTDGLIEVEHNHIKRMVKDEYGVVNEFQLGETKARLNKLIEEGSVLTKKTRAALKMKKTNLEEMSKSKDTFNHKKNELKLEVKQSRIITLANQSQEKAKSKNKENLNETFDEKDYEGFEVIVGRKGK